MLTSGQRNLTKSKVLVDYDGVVLRSHKASKVIEKRCEAFVEKVTGLRYPNSKTLNNAIYKSFGHTCYGLQCMGYNVCTNDFNKFVYKDIYYDTLGIQDYEIDVDGLDKILRLHDAYIFSNAPSDWIIGTLSTSSRGKYLLPRMRIIKQQDKGSLKPERGTFIHTLSMIREQRDETVFLIDDSFVNIKAWCGLPHTIGVWVTHDTFDLGYRLHTVKSLDRACERITMSMTKIS